MTSDAPPYARLLEPANAEDYSRSLDVFAVPEWRRSVAELAFSLSAFVLLWVAAWCAFRLSYMLTLAIALPAAVLLVRLFLIQHDCGHGSFFPGRHANGSIGRLLGVLTLTPYDVWRRAHALHHATSGNLNRRGIGDLDTLTVVEYRARNWRARLAYRLYRHPLIMFGVGPSYLFLIEHRIPQAQLRKGWAGWVSAMATNAGIALAMVLMIWAVGASTFLFVHLPIVALASSIGVWLFYVQHQFEYTYWADNESWSRNDAALHGSSHLDLPQPLRWLSANIGIHHVHHLASRIPFYKLPAAMAAHPRLAETGRVTIVDSFRAIRLKLWDEERRRLVSFREAGVE